MPISPGGARDSATENEPVPAQLAAQLARLRALCEVVPLAIAVFDEALRLVEHNARFRDLVGGACAAGEAAETIFARELADLAPAVAAVRDTGGGRARRLAFARDGEMRLVDVTLLPMVVGRGLGCAFVGGDVTERELLREQAQRTAAELAAIFDVIPEAVRVCDAEGRMIRSNALADLARRGGPAATLRELWESNQPHRPDGRPMPYEEGPLSRALRGETVQSDLMHLGHGSTSVIIEASATPLRDAEGRITGAVSVSRDVTERERLAQELEEQVRIGNQLLDHVTTEAERLERMVDERTRQLVALQEARAREQRLAALGQLAAGVMHDVNNALNPIVAAAYLVTQHAHDPALVREYAARIVKAAETGGARVARLGRFIRQSPALEPADETADLAELAAEAVTITQPLWDERTGGGAVVLDFRCSGGAIVRGAPGELRAAVINLVHNALDAMPGGGTLGLETRVTRTEAVLEVRDTGTGMTAETVERAFEPFFTTKGPRGTGLGLAEVYGVVRRHRGRVEIESAAGRGALVRLAFPLAPEGTGLSAGGGASAARVLVVDGDRDARAFAASVLASAGHYVHVAPDLDAALARVRVTDSAGYDLLVLAGDAAGGPVAAVMAAARERNPALRVALVTGEASGESPPPSDAHVLRKPLRAADLLSLLTGAG